MNNNKCLVSIVRWILIFFSIYIYEIYGLVAAFIVLALASILKPIDIDVILEKITNNKTYQIITLLYYLVVMFLVLYDVETASEANALTFVLTVGAPLIFISFYSEISSCFIKNKQGRN